MWKATRHLFARNYLLIITLGTLAYGVMVIVCLIPDLANPRHSRVISHDEPVMLAAQALMLLPLLVAGVVGKYTDTPMTPPEHYKRGETDHLGCSSHSWILTVGFVLAAAAGNYVVGKGLLYPDEGAYSFQARILASGRLMAETPEGGLTPQGRPVPALEYAHIILSPSGWFSKYPIGWPSALALPERWRLGWLASPLLGGVLLMLVGLTGREAFGRREAKLSVGFASLSPFVFSIALGRMSHAFCAVLVAGATICCLRGVRLLALRWLILMFSLIVVSLHVRPLTAVLAGVVLCGYTVIRLRRWNRIPIVIALSVVAAVVAITSVLWYNKIFTGSAWLSPYAMYRGLQVPVEITASIKTITENIRTLWRASLQSTLVYSFPGVFPFACYGAWRGRRRPAVLLLIVLWGVICCGYLIQPESSKSVIGERYWSEAYFSVALLASLGIAIAIGRRPCFSGPFTSWLRLSSAFQILVTCIVIYKLILVSQPTAKVRELAEQYRRTPAVVFLSDYFGVYYTVNLNEPEWRSAPAFFALDPGAPARADWARRLKRREWVVIRYDPQRRDAFAEIYPKLIH